MEGLITTLKCSLVLIGALLVGEVFGRSIARPLGGYERLLSRLTPGTNQLSLSHASAVVLTNKVDHDVLLNAVSKVMAKHPMLRSYIDRPEEIENGENGQQQTWNYCDRPLAELAREVVTTVMVDDVQEAWRTQMQESLNRAQFDRNGPLWTLTNIAAAASSSSSSSSSSLSSLSSSSSSSSAATANSAAGAWVFCVNHGADDQGSINLVVNDLIKCINTAIGGGGEADLGEPALFPPSMEDAIAQGAQLPLPTTGAWALYQMGNSLQFPAMVPRHIASQQGQQGQRYSNPDCRETICEYVKLDAEVVDRLRVKCRARGITVTSALSASMLAITSNAIQTQTGGRRGGGGGQQNDDVLLTDQKLRFLLSVDLRPYGSSGGGSGSDWTGGTVACAAGAVDYVLSVASAVAAAATVKSDTAQQQQQRQAVWRLAERCQAISTDIIEVKKWVPDSVRLFGFGMRYAKILPLVENDARSSGTLGRGFSCGVAEAYYATSHARNGVLFQLSCMSVASGGGEGAGAGAAPFCGTLQFTEPIISREDASLMRRQLEALVTDLARD